MEKLLKILQIPSGMTKYTYTPPTFSTLYFKEKLWKYLELSWKSQLIFTSFWWWRWSIKHYHNMTTLRGTRILFCQKNYYPHVIYKLCDHKKVKFVFQTMKLLVGLKGRNMVSFTTLIPSSWLGANLTHHCHNSKLIYRFKIHWFPYFATSYRLGGWWLSDD